MMVFPMTVSHWWNWIRSAVETYLRTVEPLLTVTIMFHLTWTTTPVPNSFVLNWFDGASSSFFSNTLPAQHYPPTRNSTRSVPALHSSYTADRLSNVGHLGFSLRLCRLSSSVHTWSLFTGSLATHSSVLFNATLVQNTPRFSLISPRVFAFDSFRIPEPLLLGNYHCHCLPGIISTATATYPLRQRWWY